MEYRKRCKVCGQIWCYTDADLRRDVSNGLTSMLHGIGGIAAGVGGNVFQQQYAADRMENDERKRVNRNQCPNCKSLDSESLTDEMFAELELKKSFDNAKVSINANASTETLLKRVELLLEDKEWATANAYCDSILDVEPENATAYLYKLMAELQVSTRDGLKDKKDLFDNKPNYQKALRFGNDELKAFLTNCTEHIKKRKEEDMLSEIYNEAVDIMTRGISEEHYRDAACLFQEIKNYKDSEQLRQLCLEKAKKAGEEAEIAEEEKNKKHLIAGLVIVAILIIALIIGSVSAAESEKSEKYNNAISLSASDDHYEVLDAISIFEYLGDYNDCPELLEKAKEELYNTAKEYLEIGRNDSALEIFHNLKEYKDCSQIAEELEKELALYDEIYNSDPYDEEVIKRAMDVVSSRKYVSVKWFEDKVYCLYEFDNKEWKYVSGDPTAISRATKTVKDHKTFTTKFSKTKGWESEALTLLDGTDAIGTFGRYNNSTFKFDRETNTLTLKEPIYWADLTAVFYPSGILEITAEKSDGTIYKCTYERVD